MRSLHWMFGIGILAGSTVLCACSGVDTGGTGGQSGATGTAGNDAGGGGGTGGSELTANIVNAASCSRGDVTAAYNSASAGDIIMIPAGNCTWVIPNFIIDKSVTLQGAGSASTIINAGAGYSETYPIDTIVSINLSSDVPARITGIDFKQSTNHNGAISIAINGKIDGSFGLTKMRIDHNKFEKGTRTVYARGWVEGVIDNNEFVNCNIAIGVIGDDSHSWSRPIEAGTGNALFIEDNTFIINNDTDREPNQQIYQQEGGRTVTRHNIFNGLAYTNGNSVFYDSHGNQNLYVGDGKDFRGQPIVELYKNTFTLYKTYEALDFRGGSVLMYDNTFTSKINSSASILLKEEESWPSGGFWCPPDAGETCPMDNTWPAEDQITNSFFWNNTFNGNVMNIISKYPVEESEFIQKDRDYFMHAPQSTGGKSTYTNRTGAAGNGVDGTMTFSSSGANAYYPYIPYIYPHPLRMAPTGATICSEGTITSSCWCEGKNRISGLCNNGYYNSGAGT